MYKTKQRGAAESVQLPRIGSLIFFASLVLMFTSIPVSAQNIPGITERIKQDQIVSFPPTTTFEQALGILSQLSAEAEGKVIIDPTGQSGPINIAIRPMNWRRALETLLRANGLEFVERATYYEVRRAESGVGTVVAPILEAGAFTMETREVNISAIFFQADRRNISEAGIDLSILFGGDFDVDIGALAGTSVSQEFFTVQGDYTTQVGSSTISTLAVLRAFEAFNLGEIIASPTVKVVDGMPGKIQVGQSFSIKQKDFAGNTTDRFVDVGTILEVTPSVIYDQDVIFIALEIKTERSAAFPEAVSIRIDKQVASTNVLLLDGEQTVIAGLFSRESAMTRKGIPILKDLPWWFFGLRYLTGFSSDDYSDKELIIFIRADLEPSLTERLDRKRATLKELLDKERSKFEEKKQEIIPD